MNFQEWLAEQISKSGLSYSELGRRGGISHSRISQIINGDGLPGEKFCLAMGKALDLPPETVLKRAGHQIKMGSAHNREATTELLHHFDELDDEGKIEVIAIVKALKEVRHKR